MVSCTYKGKENLDYEKYQDLSVWVPCDTIIIDCYWRDKDSVYWDNSILPIKLQIKEADPESFEVAQGTYYARDKNYVYFPIYLFSSLCLDTEWNPDMVSLATIIDGADPKTFKCIGEGFAVDKTHMYFFGEEIPWDNKFLDKGNREKYMKYREYSYW